VSIGSSYAANLIDYRRAMAHSPMGVTELLVAAAVAAILFPLAFVALFAVAARRQRRQGMVGPRLRGSLAFVGGLALGSFGLIGLDDPVLWLPFALAAAALAAREWRSGRPDGAGWLVCGVALPWSVAWGIFDATAISRLELPERLRVWAAFSVPTIVAVAGFRLGARASAGRARPRQPFRSFRTISAALGEPNRIGPFSLPEVSAVVAVVITSLLAPLIGAALGGGWWLGTIATVVLGAALATEAYLRALHPRSRRAMEAFMWLGRQSLDEVRSATRDGVPTTRSGAARWLRRHAPRDDEARETREQRVDVLLLAGRVSEARAAAVALPSATPEDRFARASALDIVDWWTGGPGDVPTMIEAAGEIEPAGGQGRLRAEVAIALAKVRHVAGSSPVTTVDEAVDRLAPLLAVRDQLGPLADGRLRRELWPRIFAAFLAAGTVLTLLSIATGQLL
jgi:hypothetical protein